jgi:hypothetical protein
MRAGPGRAEVPERQHEQDQAHALAEQAHEQRGARHAGAEARARPPRRRPPGSRRPATLPLIAATCSGSPPEILCVKLLSRAQQRQAAAIMATARGGAESVPALPGESHAAGDDQEHRQPDAAVEVLAEAEPRHESREDAFEVEEEGRAGRGRRLEARESRTGPATPRPPLPPAMGCPDGRAGPHPARAGQYAQGSTRALGARGFLRGQADLTGGDVYAPTASKDLGPIYEAGRAWRRWLTPLAAPLAPQ